MIVILLILVNAGTSVLSLPKLSPPDEEHIYKSSSHFQLTCEDSKPIEWKHPFQEHFPEHGDDEGRFEITTTKTTDGLRRSVLDVRKSTVTDTGYYICHHVDNPQVAVKTYIYIEDEEQLIVYTGDEEIVTVLAHQSRREVIPCKPSSPSVKLILLDPNGNEIEFDNGKWFYNPHEGFIVNDTEIDDGGSYECLANRTTDNKSQLVEFMVIVQPATHGAPKPHIDAASKDILLNNSFQLNCSASYDPGVTVELTWSVPNPKGIDGKHIFIGKLAVHKSIRNGMEQQVAHQVLNVTNATTLDEGNYVCETLDHTQKSESINIYIKIHTSDVSYVNISDDRINFNLQEPANQTIKWIVNYEAFPIPVITWSKGKLSNIIVNKNSKYVIKNEPKRTTLEIKDIEFGDSGPYFLTISAKDEKVIRNFTLRVEDKPIIKPLPESQTKLIHLGDHFEDIGCKVTAFPESTIKLFFRECIPQKRCANWTLISLNQSLNIPPNKEISNQEIVSVTNTDFQKKLLIIKGQGQKAGQYRCEACNSLGCSGNPSDKNTIIKVFVNDLSHDISNASGLIKSQNQDPVIGQSFHLTCGVLLYEFKNQLSWWWTDSNGKSNKITPGKVIVPGAILKNQTSEYSYAESLTWSAIPASASGTYTCQTTTLLNHSYNTSIPYLNVIAGNPPVIKNSTDSLLSIEQFTKLFLFCDADGLPTPRARWFKDDNIEIKEGVEDVPGGSRLEILHANANHAGKYTCRFTNINGTDVRQIIVKVVTGSGIKTWETATITVITLVIVVLLGIIFKKVYEDKKQKDFFRANQLDIFDKGNPDSINPDLPIDEQTELLPYDKRFEFPRDKLKMGKQLGAGAFGRVVKAEAVGIDNSEPVTTVAVKMVRSHGNMIGLKALMSELKIMIHLGSHLNVVNLLGACTKNVTSKGELLVIVEYCRYGNIQNYLIRNRANFINQVNSRGQINSSIGAELLAEAAAQRGSSQPQSPLGTFPEFNYNGGPTGATEITMLSMSPTGGTRESGMSDHGVDSNGHPILTSAPSNSSGNHPYPPWRSNYRGDYRDIPQQPLCTRDLLCWAFQIARGMDYLADRKILHGDLAARNVLLADNNIVKIADFGLAREVYRSGNYKKKGDGPLPVKWMAIESIVDLCFSTQSDVWAYGIVLWELFSLGKTPYPGVEVDEHFFLRLKQGYRMEKPNYATDRIYEIMRNCWENDPTCRPSFTNLAEDLGAQLESSVRRHYIELNDAYERSNNAKESPNYLKMMCPVDYVNVGSGVSPMPPRPVYENLATSPVVVEHEPSDYLDMVDNSEETGPNEGYLFMNTSQPAVDSRSENSPQVDQETNNSVKMHCVVDHSSPNPTDNQVDQPATNELSSPNYRPLNTCLDFNDLPASHQSSSSSDETSVTSTLKISADMT